MATATHTTPAAHQGSATQEGPMDTTTVALSATMADRIAAATTWLRQAGAVSLVLTDDRGAWAAVARTGAFVLADSQAAAQQWADTLGAQIVAGR